jgi:hypothetical protein
MTSLTAFPFLLPPRPLQRQNAMSLEDGIRQLSIHNNPVSSVLRRPEGNRGSMEGKRSGSEEMRKDLTHVSFFRDTSADNVLSRFVIGHHLGVTHNTWPTYLSSIPTVREKRSERSTMSPTCLQLNCLNILLKTRRRRHWQYDIRVKVAYCVLSLKIPCNHTFPTLPMLLLLSLLLCFRWEV